MNKEESVKIFDLVVREGMLPAKLDELVPLSFIGAAAVKFYQAKVKLMDQLGVTEKQRKATLADGQDAGEMLLEIEARIGELSYEEPPSKPIGLAGGGAKPSGQPRKPERLGLELHRMKAAQTIARHPEAVAEVIKEAEENEDIPTKTAVLNKVKADREKQLREKYQKETKAKKADNTARTTGEALIYLGKLREVVLILPAKIPPEGWTDESFAEANAMVEIIRKRLEAWI